VRRARVCDPVLDRGRRRLRRHGPEGVGEQLLVPACAIPGCPAWRRNRCGLLVQWLLLWLPGRESWGRVGARRDHVGLWALLSQRNGVGVHRDVPLPRADVRRPWRSVLAVDAGGSSGGRSGVARVTTMTATVTANFVAVAAATTTIATVIVLVPVVVVGRTGRRGRCRLRGRRRSVGVECHRSSI
jgi:hypothetical protein